MTDTPFLPPRLKERWFEIAGTMLGLLIVAAITWLGSLIMSMRDDVTYLKGQLPAIAQRVDRLERLTDQLDADARARFPQIPR